MWYNGGDNISIHVPIAGNDFLLVIFHQQHTNFNPRSHCRERRYGGTKRKRKIIFQSTFPLQGTTNGIYKLTHWKCYFNPRSHCRERQIPQKPVKVNDAISIHVPIAGNDTGESLAFEDKTDFNPRSHCRERHENTALANEASHFNPRSHCRERRFLSGCRGSYGTFQSTFPLQGTTHF